MWSLHKLCKDPVKYYQLKHVMAKTMCLYYKHKYNMKIEELVNTHIQLEQQAAQDYLNMAVTFLHPSKSKLGVGGFFMKMYKEELGHMEKFVCYQLLRGGLPIICGLQAPKRNNNLTLLEAFEQSLSMEKHISQLLEQSIKVAQEVKDYQFEDFITSGFLSHQMQSINEMANHVTRLTALGDDEYALYEYDMHLRKMYPYNSIP